VTEQTTFGHVIAYGAGGTLVELLSDVALRIHPLTDVDAADMIADVRWSKLLEGFRVRHHRTSHVARDHPAPSELVSICPEIASSTSTRSKCSNRAPWWSTPACVWSGWCRDRRRDGLRIEGGTGKL